MAGDASGWRRPAARRRRRATGHAGEIAAAASATGGHSSTFSRPTGGVTAFGRADCRAGGRSLWNRASRLMLPETAAVDSLAAANQHVSGAAIDRIVDEADWRQAGGTRSQHGASRLPKDRGRVRAGRAFVWRDSPAARGIDVNRIIALGEEKLLSV